MDAAVTRTDAQAELEERVLLEHIRLICSHVRRVPLPNFLLDLFLFFLIGQHDRWVSAGLWLAVSTAIQIGRAMYAHRLQAGAPIDVRRAEQGLKRIFAFNGFVRAAVVPLAFTLPQGEVQYLTTMVMLGQAAGAVVVVGGHLRIYLTWAIPLGGALALAWFSRLTFEGIWVAVLLALLFTVLASYLRAEGQSIARLVELAYDKEVLSEQLARERDRVQLERERAEVERTKAERASEAKTVFFAAASHDLRQPLFALSMNHMTLEQLAPRLDDELLDRVCRAMKRNLDEASGLLHQLMDKAKLDAGALDLELERLDLRALVHDVQQALAPDAARHGLELRVDAPRAAGRSLDVNSDRRQLQRILNNLVGNAIKFTPRGGSITLRLARAPHEDEDGARAVLSVIDTGVGIAESEQERVFEEFYQIGNPERDRTKGLGLGLSIVRRLCEMLDIRLRMTSCPGAGTTFELSMPVVDDDARAPLGDEPSAAPAVPTEGLVGLNVLVVDDEEAVLSSMRALADSLRWRMAGAEGPERVRELLADGFVPELALVDFRLRGGRTGLDVVHLLREAGHAIPTVIVTGDTAPQRVSEMREVGVQVVFKPVSGHALLRTIATAIESARSSNR